MSRNVYNVNGLTAATAATANHALAALWNPSATRSIVLYELAVAPERNSAITQRFSMRRSTARGTPGSTVTPTAEHHTRREAAPDSGFLLDLSAFSVQPTLAAGELYPCWYTFGGADDNQALIFLLPRGIEIPPGTGLVVAQGDATAWEIAEIGVVVEEP